MNTSGVSNPAPQAVYQSQRYGNFTYAVANLTAGNLYLVRLDFNEFIQNAVGERTFSVAINGVRVLNTFDVFATAGGKNKALAKQFTVAADSTGEITLVFRDGNNNAILNGLEITPVSRVVAVNAGGGAVGPYIADTDFTGGSTGKVTHGIDLSGVTDPAPMAVYQSWRQSAPTYTIPNLTPGASYIVRLHFAEDVATAADQRVQNVFINGQEVLTNFDIFAEVGAFKALVKEFTATADSFGKITIRFQTVTGTTQVSAIEVVAPPRA